MWLINTITCTLEYFNDSSIPPYLILSHTWGDEEVTFQDIKNLDLAKKMKGFQKISGICALARRTSHFSKDAGRVDHVWVDTCCIDKSSSAELTEAINSMFRWYKEARACLVYLEDLEPCEIGSTPTLEQLRPCRWFTRGWTLQELVAPGNVFFYDKDWDYRGKKEEMVDTLRTITNIDEDTLLDADNLPNVLIARRMSWAAHRQTTRTEDRAYSLLGIFDVHMPLIYGERDKAFARLQEAIVQSTTDDMSIFAWSLPKRNLQSLQLRQDPNLFASEPLLFQDCGTMERIHDYTIPAANIVLTNSGVEVVTALGADVKKDVYTSTKTDILLLNCRDAGDKYLVASIPLTKTATGFVRGFMLGRLLVNPRELHFRTLAKVHIAKAQFGTERGFPLGNIRISLEMDYFATSYFTGIKFHPQHLVSQVSPKSYELAFPARVEQFTGLMEIKFGPPPLLLASNNTVEPTVALAFLGFELEKGHHSLTDAKLWMTLVSEEDMGSVPQLHQASLDQYNPYYLSNIGHHFRSLHSISPDSLASECRVAVGSVVLKLSATREPTGLWGQISFIVKAGLVDPWGGNGKGKSAE